MPKLLSVIVLVLGMMWLSKKDTDLDHPEQLAMYFLLFGTDKRCRLFTSSPVLPAKQFIEARENHIHTYMLIVTVI